MGLGVCIDEDIKNFINNGIIESDKEIEDTEEKTQIQPSSLDLRCGFDKKIWHLPYSSIPTENLKGFLDSSQTHSFDLTEKRFLHKGAVYVLELEESLNLPSGISAKSSPKSTTGRIDVHTRLLTEDGNDFDNIEEGYDGKLFLEIVSNSMNLYLHPGYSLNQIRFFRGPKTEVNQKTLESLVKLENIMMDAKEKPISPEDYVNGNSLLLTLDLDENDPGYKLREDAPALDFTSEKNSLSLSKYFEKVNLINGNLVLNPHSFYLLKSKEIVSIPDDYCAEMVDISTELGEYRAHYAGFFDPGFKETAVMEVRNTSDVPILLRDGQRISSLKFYSLTGKPTRTYGEELKSSYNKQTGKVKAAKFFDMDK